MVSTQVKFSALDLCDRADYLGAAKLLGIQVGEWPERGSQGDSAHAEAILAAGIILSSIGGIQLSGNQGVAQEMFRKSLRLFGDSPRASEPQIWLARSYHWQGRYEEALILLAGLDRPLDARLEFRALMIEAIIYTDQGKPELAIPLFAELQTIYDQQNTHMKARFHNDRARVLRMLGETDRAVIDFDAAIIFFQQLSDTRSEAVALNNLAALYRDTERYEAAHVYADKAVLLFEQLGDNTYQAKALDQTASIYLKEGKLSEARSKISEALQLIRFEGPALNECLETSDKIAKEIKQLYVTLPIGGNDKMLRTPDSPPSRSEERRGSVMTPAQCVTYILQHPELAAALYTFHIWATNGNGDPSHDAEKDHIESMILAKTPQGERFREDQRKSMLESLAISDSAES